MEDASIFRLSQLTHGTLSSMFHYFLSYQAMNRHGISDTLRGQTEKKD